MVVVRICWVTTLLSRCRKKTCNSNTSECCLKCFLFSTLHLIGLLLVKEVSIHAIWTQKTRERRGNDSGGRKLKREIRSRSLHEEAKVSDWATRVYFFQCQQPVSGFNLSSSLWQTKSQTHFCQFFPSSLLYYLQETYKADHHLSSGFFLFIYSQKPKGYINSLILAEQMFDFYFAFVWLWFISCCWVLFDYLFVEFLFICFITQ